GGRCSVQKKFSAIVEETAAEAPGKPIEIWFQDEARVGTRSRIDGRNAGPGHLRRATRDCVGLYFRCNLSGRRKRRGARPALMRQRGHGPASCRNLDRGGRPFYGVSL